MVRDIKGSLKAEYSNTLKTYRRKLRNVYTRFNGSQLTKLPHSVVANVFCSPCFNTTSCLQYQRFSFLNKMDERRKWKNVNTEEGRRNYRRLRNELERATEKAKKEYLENACTEIMEFHRRGRYYLMYMMTKELVWRDTQGIQNNGIEDSQGNRIVDQKKVLKIWENYVKELYDRPNRPETLEVEPEEKVDTDGKAHIFYKVRWKKLLRK